MIGQDGQEGPYDFGVVMKILPNGTMAWNRKVHGKPDMITATEAADGSIFIIGDAM